MFTGSASGNRIVGNALANTISGFGGNDVCYYDVGDILKGCERRIRA